MPTPNFALPPTSHNARPRISRSVPAYQTSAARSGRLREAVRLRGAHFEDLPRRAGLFACLALGSRGLTLAALLGELIACRIEGEPLPIERDLAAAIDPARYLLRELRTGRARAHRQSYPNALTGEP
jgi:tRNA 5-methylaminomethyl-2-thiouridine biosynthesis bifunctional protein